MADLIDRIELMRQIADFGREIPKDQVMEVIARMPTTDRPIDEFDGMIFSTDKYMAFIDKKEIHIMRKDAHKVTVERTFNTEEDEE